MFSGTEAFSPADLAAVVKNDDGNFGNNGWWIILLFIILFSGGNGYGWGNNSASTAMGITDGFVLTSDFAQMENKLDSVNNGLCSLGYDQLGQMNNINTNISTQSAAIQNAITQSQINSMQNVYGLQNSINNIGTQISTGFADIGYQNATNTCAIKQSIESAKDAVINYLTQDKIATLTAENQSLKFMQSQAVQNEYLVNAISPHAVPAYTVPNPYTGNSCNMCTYGTVA